MHTNTHPQTFGLFLIMSQKVSMKVGLRTIHLNKSIIRAVLQHILNRNFKNDLIDNCHKKGNVFKKSYFSDKKIAVITCSYFPDTIMRGHISELLL